MPASSNITKGYYTYPDEGSKTLNNPLISVIIPIYGAEQFLDQALSSVQNQTYKNLEIICLNDGSKDKSLEIMQKHAADDPRIIVIDKENQGYGATCNRGLDEAHGEWISIFEPDDWLEPNMYEDMINFRKGFVEDVEIIKTPYWRIYMPDTPEEQKLNCSYKFKMKIDHQPFQIGEAIPIFHHHPSIWSAIYKKSFLEEYNIRFKPIPGAGWADNPFLAETLLQARNIIYLDQAYYCYREETKQKTQMFHRNNCMIPFDRWNEMMDIIESLEISDKNILCAHYSRGFMYAGGVLEENNPDDPELYDQLLRMFNRMNPDLVFSYPYISPAARRLFAEVRGLPQPQVNYIQYGGNLIKQGLYNLRSYGVKQVFIGLSNYLQSYKKRAGGR